MVMQNNIGTGAQNLLSGYDPASLATMGSTYNQYIRSQLGASPLAYAYGRQFSPFAQLQYLAQPAITGTTGLAGADVANPFGNFLQTYNPYTGMEFANLANQVRDALSGTADMTDPAQQLLRERFGTGEQAEQRQLQLATAPILQSIAPALRGEVGNVLSNIYEDYLVAGPEGRPSFLDFAARGMGSGTDRTKSLWDAFNIQGAGGTSGTGSYGG
tara:strand:- start:413 stop:1057 length:645 start_codon:yes stop_codon:yes gene_type:complete